jgi:hypothetical protein
MSSAVLYIYVSGSSKSHSSLSFLSFSSFSFLSLSSLSTSSFDGSSGPPPFFGSFAGAGGYFAPPFTLAAAAYSAFSSSESSRANTFAFFMFIPSTSSSYW